MGLDETHPQEASIQHHTPSPGLEPAGEEEKTGTSRNSWRPDSEAELKQPETNWTGMDIAAQNRVQWRGVVDGLAPPGVMGIISKE